MLPTWKSSFPTIYQSACIRVNNDNFFLSRILLLQWEKSTSFEAKLSHSLYMTVRPFVSRRVSRLLMDRDSMRNFFWIIVQLSSTSHQCYWLYMFCAFCRPVMFSLCTKTAINFNMIYHMSTQVVKSCMFRYGGNFQFQFQLHSLEGSLTAHALN